MCVKKISICIYLVLVFSIFLFIGCTSQEEHYNQAIENFNDENYEDATKHAKNLKEEIIVKFKDEVDNSVNNLIRNREFNKAINILENLVSIDSLNEYINDKIEEINNIEKSNQHFQIGNEYFMKVEKQTDLSNKKAMIEKAKKEFEMVISIDKLNYDSAKENMLELDTQYNQIRFDELLLLAINHYKHKEYEEAINNLRYALSYKKEDSARTLLSQYIEDFNEYKKIEKKRIESNIHKETDKVEGINWYYAKNTPKDITNFSFYSYVGQRNNRYWLRFKTGFHKSNWIFFEKILINADGNRFEIPFDEYKDKKTEVSSGVYEWVDIFVSDFLLIKLKEITEAKSVTVRFEGDKYHEDYTVSNSQKERLKQIIEFYELKQ